ncbi:MAG: DUF885 family protein [Planctomycetota bacterium]
MAEILAETFLGYVNLEPEEATSLGWIGVETALRDMSEDGEARRESFYREVLSDLARLEKTRHSVDEELDRKTLRRHAEFELFAIELGFQCANPQWALYPFVMTRYLAAQGPSSSAEALVELDGPWRERARQVAVFLKEHQGQLLRAKDAGQVAHASFIESLCDVELPAARRFWATLEADASEAVDEHIEFLRRELLVVAPETSRLGSEDYAERLRLSYCIETPLGDIVKVAQASLAETQAEMLALAQALDLPRRPNTFADVVALMGEMQNRTLAEIALDTKGVEEHYREIMSRVMNHMVAIKEFEAIEVDELGMDVYPEGMRDRGAGTNWPAPLLKRSGRGQFVIHPEPAAHSMAWDHVLAVHEGVPGHFLQSRGFQGKFSESKAPVRFLAVADDVAIPRLNMCAMLNIEGYAVYAEECVRRSGFYETEQELFALAAHALRAVRVVAEMQFHRGEWSKAETEAYVLENSGISNAHWELERYQRCPLQAVAYFFGAQEFWRLREQLELSRGESFSAAAFHEEIMTYGPVLPQDIANVIT